VFWSTLQKSVEFLPHLLMFSIIKKIYSIKKRKKLRKSTWVHLPNSRSGSWDWDNIIERKKKNYETQFLTNSMLRGKIRKEIN